ncbi:MAG: Clostripain precursor [Candidatus Heimdallarchaeota archaeon AB_125]|nr:MAG: Clostripain precursor [Candidatus Heimdallarchaeota archaeon AB_125]
MKNLRKGILTFILFLLLFFTSSIFIQGQNFGIDDTLPSIDATTKDWTVMIYLCADNNLEYFGLDDLNEMEQAGGTTVDVNVIAMVDRCAYDYETPEFSNDWSETRYYTIVGDGSTTTFTSPMNQSLGEVNMGDPQSLRNFIDWGLANYPSDKTALIIWDHGGGLSGVCWDEDNGDDHLTINELETALTGYYFDFLGFDACLMGQLEVLYELKDYCEIYTASMLNEPGDGWDYYESLSALIATPSMSASVFAQNVCQDYADFYVAYSDYVTLSAYNTTELIGIETLIDDVSSELINHLPTYGYEIYSARLNSMSQLPDLECDYYEFLTNLQSISAPSLNTAVGSLITALDDVLVISSSTFITDPYGLWGFLPALPYEHYNDFYIYSNQSVVNSYVNFYYDLEFVLNTNWEDFLYQWRVALGGLIPEVSTSSPYSDSLVDGGYLYAQADLPTPTPGYTYEASLSMDFGPDFDLEIWNEADWIGLPNGFYGYGGEVGSITELVTISPAADNPLFFYIYSYSGAGSFTLSLSEVDFDEDLFEENDDYGQAAEISTNTIYNLIANDDDYFFVYLPAGVSVSIGLDFNPTVVDLDLYLDDFEYTELDYSENYDTTEYINYITTYSGLYYVIVTYFDGAAGEDYALIVSVETIQISSIDISPSYLYQGDSVTVSGSVTGINTITSVILSYSYDSIVWTNISMTLSIGSSYEATFVLTDDADYVYIQIFAYDSEDNWELSAKKTYIVHEDTSFTSFPWYLAPLLVIGIAFIFRKRITKT